MAEVTNQPVENGVSAQSHHQQGPTTIHIQTHHPQAVIQQNENRGTTTVLVQQRLEAKDNSK